MLIVSLVPLNPAVGFHQVDVVARNLQQKDGRPCVVGISPLVVAISQGITIFTSAISHHQCWPKTSLNHFQHQDSQQAYPHHVSCSFSFLFSIRRARNSNIKLYSTVLLITSIVNYFENMFLFLNFLKIYLVLFILKYFCSIHNTL